MGRPITTLFMLMSVDGKISTGFGDTLDFDQDLPRITSTKSGLQQYYDLEQETDLWSLNSGKVQAKMGVNTMKMPEKTPVNFVLMDNNHLTEHGVRYFCEKSKEFVLITSNWKHPGYEVEKTVDNMSIIEMGRATNLSSIFEALKFLGCDRLTIQTGGTLNGLFLRNKLIDYIDIVVAPLLVGGKDTPTLIDGESIKTVFDVNAVGQLKLISADKLKSSYLRLRYKVIG